MIIDRLYSQIMWLVTMLSFAWSMVTMYIVMGVFSANCGVWLPYWSEIAAMCVKALGYCHGA
jgi:hypothetical protein